VAAAAGASAAATRLEEPAAQRVARRRGVLAQARVRGREPARAKPSQPRRAGIFSPSPLGEGRAASPRIGRGASLHRSVRRACIHARAWRAQRRKVELGVAPPAAVSLAPNNGDGREAMRPLSNQSICPPPPCLKGCVCGTRLLEDAVP
jgi:hypothetical protein